MPPHLDLLQKRWSSFDLPILPFLAPRVFQTWPSGGRRTETTQAIRKKRDALKRSHNATQIQVTEEPYQSESILDWHPTQPDSRSTLGVQNRQETGRLREAKGRLSRTRGPESFDEFAQAPKFGSNPSLGLLSPLKLAAGRSKSTSWHDAIDEVGGYKELETRFSTSNHCLESSISMVAEEHDDGFRRKYEEIWGKSTKKLPPDTATNKRVQVGVNSWSMKPCLDLKSRAQWNPITLARKRLKARDRRRNKSPPGDAPQQKEVHTQYRYRTSRRRFGREAAFQRHVTLQEQRINLAREKRAKRSIHPRAKFVRLTLGRGSILPRSSSWHTRFAILKLRQLQTQSGQLKASLHPHHPVSVPKAFLKRLIDYATAKSTASLRRIWTKIPASKRMLVWPELMITALESHPDKALQILEATYIAPHPPSYAISDCLDYVLSHYVRDRLSYSQIFILYLANKIFSLMQNGPEGHIHLSQHSAYLLLSRLTDWKLKKLYEKLANIGHPLHENTLMQFATRFAKSGHTNIAFKILQTLKVLRCDFNTPKMLSLCTTLLQRRYLGPDTTCSENDMFEFMLECGMSPNLITYNVLLQNSLEAGDHETGWKIHDMMIDTHIQPDSYTYSILMNDAKLRMDPLAIRKAMEIVRERGFKNSRIITDILHAIFFLHQQDNTPHEHPVQRERQTAFDRMLPVYCEYFLLEPLARIVPNFFEIYPAYSNLETSRLGRDPMYPEAPTLVVMLTGLLLGSKSSQKVKQFYDHFLELAVAGNPAVASLMGTTHVWDLVLMTFSKFRDRLPDCPRLIGDMLSLSVTANKSLEPSPVSVTSSIREDSNAIISIVKSTSEGFPPSLLSNQASISEQLNISHCPVAIPKPTAYTWSILLKIFMDQSQPRAAEKILRLMKIRGVSPTVVTWNTLSMGYAKMQDPSMTIDAIQRMEEVGLKPNEHTMRGLYKIRDRRALVEALRKKEKNMRKVIRVDQNWLNNLVADLKADVGGNEGQDSRSAGGVANEELGAMTMEQFMADEDVERELFLNYFENFEEDDEHGSDLSPGEISQLVEALGWDPDISLPSAENSSADKFDIYEDHR